MEESEGDSPDVIFLDINMPIKDGIQCLKDIRADKKYLSIPIIMYTTSDHLNDVEETFRAGANLFAVKAVSLEKQINILRKIFEGSWKKNLLIRNKNNFLLK